MLFIWLNTIPVRVPVDATTALNDIRGLKLPVDELYSLRESYVRVEENNISLATIKYLSAAPSER